MSLTDIVILRRHWHYPSSLTHDAVLPVIGDLSFFRRGLVRSSVLFVVHCVVRDSSHVVQALSVIFIVIVGAEFACRWGVFLSLTGPMRALL